MKRLLCCGILAASVVAAYVHYRGNQQVYSISIYAGGWSCGPSWQVGSPPHDVGLGVWREVGMPNEWGKKRDIPTYTEFHAGSHRVSVRGDYYNWLVWVGRVGAALGIGLLFWIVITPRFRAKDETEIAAERIESS